ncbi:MAG: DUF2726 domain-containing protein [Pseudomonadota bacterium]|jgi:hypothetical protein|uniref:DUF2726 domain-containing protein n=1 Tax=Burkholderiaceae TaxID=119060 RepID=UPI0010F6F894|nr:MULTISPECIES: DUF2726 domain-containing protein [Burkholderiaceae]
MNNSSVVILVLVVLVVIAVVSPKKTRKAAEARYKPRALLTKNEVEFFHRLTQALPTEYIFPQVAMSALMDPVAQGKQRLLDLNRILQKRVDYAIYTRDLKLIAIVELDDRTHNRVKDRQRDLYVASAGIRTVRFESSNRPGVAEIHATIFPKKAALPVSRLPKDAMLEDGNVQPSGKSGDLV